MTSLDPDNIKGQLKRSSKCRLSASEVDLAFAAADNTGDPLLPRLVVAIEDGQIDTFRARLARECPEVKEVAETARLGQNQVSILAKALPSAIAVAWVQASCAARMLQWDVVEQIDLDREVRCT